MLPDVQLDIAFGNDMEDYLRGDADVAIHLGKGAWPQHQSVLLRTGYEFLVCSPKLLEGDAVLSKPSDLAAFTLLHESDTSGWTDWMAQEGVTHPSLLSGPIFPSTQEICNKVLACEGIALGGDIMVADLLFCGALIKPIGKVRKSSHSLYFLQMKYGDNSETNEVFRTWLLDELSEHRRQTAKLRKNETSVLSATSDCFFHISDHQA